MKELENLKEELNSSIYKGIHFTDDSMQNVLSTLQNKRKLDKKKIIKPMFAGIAATVCLMFFLLLTLSDTNLFTGPQSKNDATGITPTYNIVVNEQLLVDAKQRRFSPVPSLTMGFSKDLVKRILGNPDKVYSSYPNETHYVMVYDNLRLVFGEDGKLWKMQIDNLDLEISELSSVLGNPIYQQQEENGDELYTYVVLDNSNKGWYFHCSPSQDNKNTIESVSFTSYPIFLK